MDRSHIAKVMAERFPGKLEIMSSGESLYGDRLCITRENGHSVYLDAEEVKELRKRINESQLLADLREK